MLADLATAIRSWRWYFPIYTAGSAPEWAWGNITVIDVHCIMYVYIYQSLCGQDQKSNLGDWGSIADQHVWISGCVILQKLHQMSHFHGHIICLNSGVVEF